MKTYGKQQKETVTLTGKLLTTKEAAEKWGVSKWTIYDWVKDGKIRPIVGMKSWRFLETDINSALERL